MVSDPKLSRQKSLNLTRLSNIFRQFAEVKVMSSSTTEEQLLTELEKSMPSLILLPWHSYIEWRKIEGLLGLTRSSGPTVAGYHCGELNPKDIGASPDNSHMILLDFDGTSPAESALLVRALLFDSTRSGILPLVDANSEIRWDAWYEGQTLGPRLDAVLALPQLGNRGWTPRGNAIRILVSALWGLVFKESCGIPSNKKIANGARPRGSLQIGIANHCVAFRLCYSLPLSTPKDTVDFFWPQPNNPSSSAQLLLRYSDVLRVHRLIGSKEIEVVAILFKSGGAEKAPHFLQTFWIEPLQDKLVSEPILPDHEDRATAYLPLDVSPASTTEDLSLTASVPLADGDAQSLILELRSTLDHVKAQLFAREAYIAELKGGGIGTAAPLTPPDADSLLEAFSQRFTFVHEEINRLLEQTERPRSEWTAETPLAHKKLAELWSREEAWVRRFSEMIRYFQEDRDRFRKAG